MKKEFLNKGEVSKEYGTMCQSSWDNLAPYLNKLFMIKSTEKITTLIISEEGLKVKIENK